MYICILSRHFIYFSKNIWKHFNTYKNEEIEKDQVGETHAQDYYFSTKTKLQKTFSLREAVLKFFFKLWDFEFFDNILCANCFSVNIVNIEL